LLALLAPVAAPTGVSNHHVHEVSVFLQMPAIKL
jgi:hypothetical protein